jgi:hypothetical protein
MALNDIDPTSDETCEHDFQRRFCPYCRGAIDPTRKSQRQEQSLERARHLCTECGYVMDNFLVENGYRTHVNCAKDDALEPPSRPSVDRNTTPVSHASQATSRAAANAVLPNTGTQRRMVYDAIVAKGEYGMCDHEIEVEVGLRIPSVCAARNSLMNDGWVYDSGRTRKTPQGHMAIVWLAIQ